MKIILSVFLSLLLSVSVFAADFRAIPSPDSAPPSAAACAALFLGKTETGSDGRFVTVVVCASDLPALEQALGGPVTPSAVILRSRGEAAAFCESHCGCVLLLPVDD